MDFFPWAHTVTDSVLVIVSLWVNAVGGVQRQFSDLPRSTNLREVLDTDDMQGLVAVDSQLPNGRPGGQRDPVGLRRHFNLLQMGSTRANLKADGLLNDGQPLQDLLIDGRLA